VKTRAKSDTKERILMAALMEMSSSHDHTASLGGVAKRVGISKAAIFRHFKDKSVLVDAMKSRFFDDVSVALLAAAPESGILSSHDMVRAINRFLVSKPEYFGVIKMLCSQGKGMDTLIAHEFGSRGIKSLKKGEGANLSEMAGVYCFTTIVYFVLHYRMVADQNGTTVTAEQFADKLSGFIIDGWPEIRDLTPAEKKECDKKCIVTAESLPGEDRFFGALIAVIFKFGFSGITMERIAEELGMVKSSIYAFFANKEELVHGLLRKEVTYLIALLSEKLAGTTDVSVAVYIFLHVMYNYMVVRPALIAVIVWHFCEGGQVEDLYGSIIGDDISAGLRLVAESTTPDFDVPLPRFARAVWLATLPASFLLAGHRHMGGGPSVFGDPATVHKRITEMHAHMGKRLPNNSACVITKMKI
jgi:AcrR family transcriptional regulator